MGRRFNIARLPSGTPNIISVRVTAAQTFKKGALLVDTAAGTVSECGADPVRVYGVAMEDAFSKPGGTGIANSPSIITGGNNNECSVAIADRSQVFSCRGVNGGTDPVVPLQTHIGETYGVAKVGNDWVLDLAEVTVMPCEIVDIDVDNNLFLVKFREASIALP
jgi:hypothetical protein